MVIAMLMMSVMVEVLIENIRELEIAKRSKDDFLVNVSHEIRTPINADAQNHAAFLREFDGVSEQIHNNAPDFLFVAQKVTGAGFQHGRLYDIGK